MPARTSIKDRIVEVIKNSGAGPVANRVYIGRQNVLPDAATGWPLVYVYMVREDIDTQTMGSSGRHQTRTMVISVAYFAKSATPEGSEDGMDTACEAIEALVAADTTLNSTCEDIILTSAEYMYDGSEELSFGRAIMLYRVVYFSNEP